MGADSKIEWCDHTFNPWIGCTKVAPGCTHCYAEAFAKRYNKAAWGPQGTRVKTSEAYWRKPIKWNHEAHDETCPAAHRPRVFCASLADVFEDWQGPVAHHTGEKLWRWTNGQLEPETLSPPLTLSRCPVILDDLRRDLFALIDATPNLDWLILTKRPENVRRMWPIEPAGYSAPPLPTLPPLPVHKRLQRPNVWLGTSISDQATANANLPELYALYDLCPIIFVSAEPLLGPIVADPKARTKPDWVIIGGESGHGARPCDLAWIRSLVAQCKAAGVPAFVKQLGAYPFEKIPIGTAGFGLRDKKGGDIFEWPEDLRVREFPDTSITQLGATP